MKTHRNIVIAILASTLMAAGAAYAEDHPQQGSSPTPTSPADPAGSPDRQNAVPTPYGTDAAPDKTDKSTQDSTKTKKHHKSSKDDSSSTTSPSMTPGLPGSDNGTMKN